MNRYPVARRPPLTYQHELMYLPRMTVRSPNHVALLSLFQALAEETRLEIVALLSGGERCVCELQDELDAAQSRLSFHLRKLKDAGLVSDRRQGRWVYYALVPEALEELSGFLHAMEPQHGWSRPATRGSACCEEDDPCDTR